MNIVKSILSVVVGYAVWTVIFLGGAAGIRGVRADVHDEQGITGDVATLLMYLVLSFAASVAAGWVGAKIAGRAHWVHGGVLAVCLLATGIPVQLSAWDVLPVWYNLVFLVMLDPDDTGWHPLGSWGIAARHDRRWSA